MRLDFCRGEWGDLGLDFCRVALGIGPVGEIRNTVFLRKTCGDGRDFCDRGVVGGMCFDL